MSAIQAWPVPGDEAETFHHVIRRADAAYLDFLALPPDERKSLPVAGPKLLEGL